MPADLAFKEKSVRRIILILICFLIPLNLDARGLLESKDIKLSVKVDKKEIYSDQQIQLEVTLEVEGRGGPRLVIPELEEDFEIKGKIIQNRKIIRQDKKNLGYCRITPIHPQAWKREQCHPRA